MTVTTQVTSGATQGEVSRDKRKEARMVVLDAAKEATAAGFVVLPAREDGSKVPDLKAWRAYTKQKPSKEELRAWFTDCPDRAGMGLVMGAVSGYAETLDFDDRETYEAFCALCTGAGVADLLERIIDGYREDSPRGVHLVYRCPGVAEGSQKLAQRPMPDGSVKSLIETRGEGAWIVSAPSSGKVHESGRPYLLQSGGPATVATITPEEREVLLGLARSMDELPRKVTGPAPAATGSPSVLPGKDARPGDLFNAQASWAEILEPHGWRFFFRDARGLDHWTRPGKKRGTSATTGPRGGDPSADYLWNFSGSVAELDTEQGYSKFRVYALLNHGGDWRAAAQELGARGYRGQAPTLVAASPHVSANGNGPHTADRKAERPYRFEPVFPDDHFVGRYIAYAREKNDAAHEYHEAMAVQLIGTVTPGVRAYLSAWPDGLATNLYVALVGESTRSRKSTAIKEARRLLDLVDPDAVFPDRFTPEALLEQLAMRSGKPALWFPDEFGQVLEDMERKPLLKDALLTLYDSPRAYDYARHSKRVKGGGTVEDHDRVVDPHWSIIGATTEALFDVISNRDIQSGLLPRFAYIYPQQRPPRMGLRETTPDMRDEQARLASYLRELATWAAVARGGVRVEFAPGTIQTIDEFMYGVEETGQTILARLPAMAVKVAIISALGEEVPKVPRVVIEQRDAERAVALCRRWQSFAIRFANDIGGFSRVERQMQQRVDKAVAFVRETGQRTRQEVIRYLRVSAKEMDEIQRTAIDSGEVEVLQERPEGMGAGRPATIWRVAGKG